MRRLNRNFSLLDAMVLIAATAVGLAIDRYYWSKVPLWAGPMRWPLRGFIAAGIIFSAPLWMVSMIERRYRPAADWSDRLGRVIGLYWVACILALGWMLNL